MKIGVEFMTIILICFLFTVGCAYLWGYAVGNSDNLCYVPRSS